MEYIVFLGHVAALEPSTWWRQVLFATRLRIAAWTPHLHTVVTGTLIQGTDSGPRARLWGGYEPAGGAKAGLSIGALLSCAR
jgi:hypothetical protein